MPSHMRDGVALTQCRAQGAQGFVLGRLKGFAFQAFELDADRVVVALLAPTVAGNARMPGLVLATDELHQLTTASYHKVGRNLQATDLLKIRVRVEIEPIREQGFDLGSAINARRQADGVDDDQIGGKIGRAHV